jgi:gamma-glutamyltranspeptidase
MHHQWLPDRVSIEKENGPSEKVLATLKSMGHTITAGGRQGDAHSIWVAPDGAVYGINEKRTPDGKASVPQLTAAASGR